MTKPHLQKIYLSRLYYLSNRARHILFTINLDKFESFYAFFCTENRNINFAQIHNCGNKTEKELKQLVQVITSLSRNIQPESEQVNKSLFTERQELSFNQEFNKLSNRSKNVLANYGVTDINSFIIKVLKNNNLSVLRKLPNCGVKTIDEVAALKEEVLKIISLNNHEENLTIANDFIESSNKKVSKENDIKSIAFNSRIDLFFEQQFDQLKTRSKNILISLDANNLVGFFKRFQDNDSYDVLSSRNCGEKTKNEIEDFKRLILNAKNENGKSSESTGLFKDIEIYLLEGKVLKETELHIFSNYYCFISGTTYEPLNKIAENSSLTTERIRQISIDLLDKLKIIIMKVVKKGCYSFETYFKDAFFCTSQALADDINIKEETKFNPAFVTLVLRSLKNSDYDFVCIEKKPREMFGVFYKLQGLVNFQKCFDYLIDNLEVRRDKDVELSIAELIDKASNKGVIYSTDREGDKNEDKYYKALEILKFIISYIPGIKSLIAINNDSIILLRNSKKLKYEFLVDILNEFKKPLHFTDLYNECLRRKINISSASSVHGAMQNHPEIFGLKGPGFYGLLEWGGYFGTIGDVTEQILKESMRPVNIRDLEMLLCRELYISQDSILNVLLRYEPEKRFVKMKNNAIGLKEWV